MREKTGLGNMVCLLQFGTLSNELTNRNIERFATDVMPFLQERTTAAGDAQPVA
jgi:hypothetical protein